jgi:hypothetical protein
MEGSFMVVGRYLEICHRERGLSNAKDGKNGENFAKILDKIIGDL